jgi:subtilisin family serine protease
MPPPAPSVAPVVGGEYANDADQNRIDDQLEKQALESARLSAAGSRNLAAQAKDEAVSVELIFSRPVTQSQIEGFIGLGGTITYMYQNVSYGWIGRITLKSVEALPALMGSSLVLVEPTAGVVKYSDKATANGRARAVWKSGFAGNAAGFNGDPNTTIGFLDSGVDADHKDLAGRCVYWSDLSSSNSPVPVDDDGHGTMVTGVACGTGAAGGADTGPFTFTYADPYPYYAFLTYPISLPTGVMTLTSRVYWVGPSAAVNHAYWLQGTAPNSLFGLGNGAQGVSPLTLTNTWTITTSAYDYVVYLRNTAYQALGDVAIVTTVSKYPGVGDGFNRFRGIAPGCNYAMVNLPMDSETSFQNGLSAGIDLLVSHRIEKNVKIISISSGLSVYGIPAQSTSLRNKIATAVNNGMIVVAAAGNSADDTVELYRAMADPPRAAMAITVGASNDKNGLTDYSTYGFADPRSSAGEDFKPDLVAPGGSWYYSSVIGPDSGSSDALGADREPNDYMAAIGTSLSAPFVSGSAALVVQAMERAGTQWDFTTSSCPRYVKMILCATACETNLAREGNKFNPTLQRAANGPNGYPVGKDMYEGYGLINPDAAIEAVTLTYTGGSNASDTFGTAVSDRRVWARNMDLKFGFDISLTLTNPDAGDFDLYLYSGVPSDTGTPVLLASGAKSGNGIAETFTYSPTADGKGILVVKRVSGSGTFILTSKLSGPPVAHDVYRSTGLNTATTIALDADDDGAPNPPGKLTYVIASLPLHGRLEQVAGGAVIASAPATLAADVNQVVYRPDTDWLGEDSFTYYADDGGTPPSGGPSDAATVHITVVREISVVYPISTGSDDGYFPRFGTSQNLTDPSLSFGLSNSEMRFTGVNIPRGASILRADLKVRSYTTGLFTMFTATIRGEAADNAPAFSTQPMNTAALTAASQSWPLTTGWQGDTPYETPDIGNIVQEIVNRSGWSAGNALAIVIQGHPDAANDRKIWSYEGNPANAPQLEVTYQP